MSDKSIQNAKRRMQLWQKIKARLLNLLFPEDIKCIFCGTDVPDFNNKPYCAECEKILPFNTGHKCQICDQPIYNEATVCDFCQKQKRYFKKAFCPFLYNGVVKNSILGYKENNQRYKAKTFAKFIVQDMDNVQIDKITYIPMTPKKEKQRTFNQAKLLAEEIGKLLNIPVVCLFSKTKDGKTQKSSTYKQRHANIIGMYTTKKATLKKTDNILIVDDIITTCATINYCAGLIYPKVKNIYICAIARDVVKKKIVHANYNKKQTNFSVGRM